MRYKYIDYYLFIDPFIDVGPENSEVTNRVPNSKYFKELDSLSGILFSTQKIGNSIENIYVVICIPEDNEYFNVFELLYKGLNVLQSDFKFKGYSNLIHNISYTITNEVQPHFGLVSD